MASLAALTGCLPLDDDDDATCAGTFSWDIAGLGAGAGDAGQTCALSQGASFITINTAGGGVDWQITFSAFTGEGTHTIVERGDWNITGHHSDESWWATAGSFTVDTWADPQLAGSFDVTGGNADESLTFAATGSFDVTVAPYEE